MAEQNFLYDRDFIKKINRYRVKEYKAAIMVLDFQTDRPLARLEGKVVSGNMSLTNSSSTRRTCSMTLLFDKDTYNIASINNYISIDKKISLSVGFQNPFYHDSIYKEYGTDLWFKQGVFYITKATSSVSVSGCQVAMNLIDKMGKLNGVCGGTLPASTSFHESIIIDDYENVTTENPLIKDIIKEAVHHFGAENYPNIIVEDVPDYGRIVLQYIGDTPLWCVIDRTYNTGTGVVFYPAAQDPFGAVNSPSEKHVFYKGDNFGYKEVPLIYPGELILKAGSTIDTLLSEIVKTLGNYEYFYDVNGYFHFQQIKNYEATNRTPTSVGIMYSNDQLPGSNPTTYYPYYTDDEYINEFSDKSLINSISFDPDYSKIKNDFVCWGSKQINDTDPPQVRYHLAIDKKPSPLDISPADYES